MYQSTTRQGPAQSETVSPLYILANRMHLTNIPTATRRQTVEEDDEEAQLKELQAALAM